MQTIIPYLAYEDAPTALTFLRDAFGFEERFRMAMQDGRIGHAEVALGDSVLFLASLWKEVGNMSPKDLPGVHCQLYCHVDDVDAHYRRARDAGATVINEPEDSGHGDRTYRALDFEGHRWIFGSPISDNAGASQS
jgi:PhnB protein